MIYRIDLSEPSGYVYAQSFQMREGDLVYVSNAPAAEVQKFVAIIGAVTAPTVSSSIIYSDAVVR